MGKVLFAGLIIATIGWAGLIGINLGCFVNHVETIPTILLVLARVHAILGFVGIGLMHYGNEYEC